MGGILGEMTNSWLEGMMSDAFEVDISGYRDAEDTGEPSLTAEQTFPAAGATNLAFIKAPAPRYEIVEQNESRRRGDYEVKQEWNSRIISLVTRDFGSTVSADIYRRGKRRKKTVEVSEDIAFGTITPVEIKKIPLPDGKESEILVCDAMPADKKVTFPVRVELDKRSLYECPERAVSKLFEAGVMLNLTIASCEKKLAAAILKLFDQSVCAREDRQLAFKDEKGAVVLPGVSGEIMSDAEFAGIIEQPETDNLCAVAAATVCQITHLPSFQGAPPIWVTGLGDQQKQVLADLIGLENPRKLGKAGIRDEPDIPLVIDVDSASKRIQTKAIREAVCGDRKCGIIFATTDIAAELPDVPEWEYATIPLSGLAISSAPQLRAKISELLSRSPFTDSDLAQQTVEEADFDSHHRDIAKLMVGIVDFLTRAVVADEKQAESIVRKFTNQLAHKLSNPEFDAGALVRKIATNGTYPLYHADCLLKSDLATPCFCYTDRELRITARMMSELAQIAGFSSRLQFAKALDTEKLIEHGRAAGLQKACRFGYGETAGSDNFYVIPLDRLFCFGEVGLVPDEFGESRPEIQLSIGKSGEKEVFFTLDKADGSANGHVYICGKTRSGKTTLAAHLAQEAVKRCGAAVVSFGVHTPGHDDTAVEIPGARKIYVGTEDLLKKQSYKIATILQKAIFAGGLDDVELFLLSRYEDEGVVFSEFEELITFIRNDLSDTDERTALIDKLRYLYDRGLFSERFDWNKCAASGESVVVICEDDEVLVNSLLRGFYMFQRSRRQVQPCLFLCDECDRLNIAQKGVLVDDFLRRGAKYGIMLVVISQYLNSQNAANLTNTLKEFGTIIAFDPISDALRYMRLSINDAGVRAAINSCGRHYFLAVGNISTDCCFLNHPVIAKLDLNGNESCNS